MNNAFLTFSALIFSFAWLSTPLSAESLLKTLENTANDVKDAISSPTQRAVEGLIKGDTPKEALDASISGEVRKIQSFGSLQSAIDSKKMETIRKLAGDDAANLAGWVYAPKIFAYNMAAASAGATEAILVDGKPADIISGIPLASALRQAHAYYDKEAKPIPEDLKILMTLTFSQETLNKSRYAVSSLEANLPAIINALRADFGEFRAVKYDDSGNEISQKKVHAVVVGDIIVFSDEVPSSNLFFWGHELHHVDQYSQMGFEEFAAKYQSDYKGIEAEADDVGKQAVEDAEIVVKVATAIGK